MDTIDFTRFALAFVFVLGLIGVLAVLLRKFGKTQGIFGAQEEEGRIHILETRYLDPKRRLVLVALDDREHLLLLAEGREMVLEGRHNEK